MNENLHKACNDMTKTIGYAGWDQLPPTIRIEIMQLVQLQIIATQLEEIDRTLNSRG